jgi:hypothetical protein
MENEMGEECGMHTKLEMHPELLIGIWKGRVTEETKA